MKRDIRINFQLVADLADQFEAYSQELHSTRSDLLRGWVLNAWPEDFESVKDLHLGTKGKSGKRQSVTFFNLRLDSYAVRALDELCRELGWRRSTLLRRLIFLKLEEGRREAWLLREPRLERSSKSSLECQWQWQTTEELIANAHQQLRKGELVAAQELVDFLEERFLNKPRSTSSLVAVDILRALVARHNRQLSASARLFRQAIERAKSVQDFAHLATVYSQLGVVADIQDDPETAVTYSKKSLSYLKRAGWEQNSGGKPDSGMGLDHTLSAKLRLLDLFALQQDFAAVERITEDVSAAQESILSFALEAKLMNRLAMADIRLGDLPSAWQKLEISYSTLVRDSQVEKRYAAENLGLIHLLSGERDQARNFLREAEVLEKKFRACDCFSKNKLLQLFLLSEDNFETAFPQAQTMVELQHQPIYLSWGRYVLYSMQYLYGSHLINKPTGEKKLKTLARSGKNAMIRNAAEMTLKHQRLWPAI